MLMLGIEIALFVALIAVYCGTCHVFNSVDGKLMKYMSEHKCADGVLETALKEFSIEFEYKRKLAGLGLAFVMICFMILII